MTDLISRQAAIDGLYEMSSDIDHLCTLGDYVLFLESLSSQPEIIRCKDCKYMTEHYDTDGNSPYWTCSAWDSGTDYDGFCHYAERRTDDVRGSD